MDTTILLIIIITVDLIHSPSLLAERGGQFYTDHSHLIAQAFQSRPLSKGHRQFDNAITTTVRDDHA